MDNKVILIKNRIIVINMISFKLNNSHIIKWINNKIITTITVKHIVYMMIIHLEELELMEMNLTNQIVLTKKVH